MAKYGNDRVDTLIIQHPIVAEVQEEFENTEAG